MFFYALERVADGERWGSKLVIGLLVGAGMTVVAGESASMMPRLLKQRTVLAAGIANVAMYWTLVTYIYFLVLYFQAIMGASVIDSAVNMLPLVVTCSVFSILAGVLVTSTGYFTPPAIAGTSLTLIGAGLLTTLGEHTITVTWAGFQILVGVGLGLSLQQGIFSMQVVLNAADIPAGTSLQTLCQSLGGAIAVSVGNVLLASTFHSHERQLREAGVDANEVLRSGATAFRSRVSGHDLDVLLNMYAEGLRNTFVTSAAVAGVALIATCLMEMRKAAETTAASSSRSEERKDTVGD
ncbi:Efflux pump bfoC [Fulvia fulva]|uniref:Efflux pump bfoC n=1 Tax=Passalora fulva TaxID=5499 RepID=A0A9Q8LDF1_PASFU|nr:Efflux pump bfoC [Fulvia fulva]KAK4629563.1 Efflux pump bfoC [Fulvia fulva]KAK4630202.1 Efflux pump bfoC [Fulvia fulva]UJO15455.1 Efflux pump bfoC [Fulvia fulva]WPV12755.1 Efflux pump bfoC [Fulvia fulva]WPV27338.1 Efflux pump bfoC [Fulvia fulva]